MQGGDLSNKVSPAIVIDVDKLIVKAKTAGPFKIGHELAEGATKVLNALFSLDLSVYLLCYRFKQPLADQVEKFLEEHYLPYTRFYWYTKTSAERELDEVITLPNVTHYFRHNSFPERVTIRSAGKAIMIDNIMEVSHYL
jgi:hypothetical protein